MEIHMPHAASRAGSDWRASHTIGYGRIEHRRSRRRLTFKTGRIVAEASKSEVIQVIGKTVTVYRHNPKLERKPGAAPPWVV